MLLNALALLASAALYQHATAQEAMRPPRLVSANRSPLEAAALGKRDTCSDGAQCFIGACCGDGCASNCCGHDQGGVGCGITERCSFSGNVFIGCCPMYAIGGCTGTATRVTIHTPYSTVTFGAETTAATTTEQSFSLPTAPATPTESTRTTDSSTEQSFSLPTASRTGRTTASTSSDTTDASTPTSDSVDTTTASSATASSAVATSTSAGLAPMVTAFVPSEVNLGAMAVLGAWMAL
ncbi:predicted protein [Aspergillus terreus NIH2624]|uniref:GPI anchored protein n=1 Tax=Aspergillus terreus (strain NIH 2624 / FGSC A1156) TaxID=341663 RepID=Q0CVY0_ASPTN|nr:uncharacterized protein ATEG_02154 [Aspergillus terreus NIH2624]EAU37116.1 predicted protein [Aspergillus terreus NIH2624]KAG2416535.1 hypothetical protein HFD88_007750 [Aspergillus terreus]